MCEKNIRIGLEIYTLIRGVQPLHSKSFICNYLQIYFFNMLIIIYQHFHYINWKKSHICLYNLLFSHNTHLHMKILQNCGDFFFSMSLFLAPFEIFQFIICCFFYFINIDCFIIYILKIKIKTTAKYRWLIFMCVYNKQVTH